MSQIQTGAARVDTTPMPKSICRSGLGLGTQVLTTDGAIPVEYLMPGDRIITLDRGAVPLARLSARSVPASQMVRLRPSALNEAGGRDILLAARQKIVLRDWRAQMIYGRKVALVEARRLVDGDYVEAIAGDAPWRLFQLHFASRQHVVMLGDGVEVTSAKVPPVTAQQATT